MIFFVDVILIKIEMILKGSFKIGIENNDNEFIINEFSFKERLRVVFIKKESY